MRGACSIAGSPRLQALLSQFEALARRDEVPDGAQLAVLRGAFADAATALGRELG